MGKTGGKIMPNCYDDIWLASVERAIQEGRAYINCSTVINPAGRITINGYNHDTGWVTTGDGYARRSFMVCPGDIHIEAKK
jgi:hypothetical protein